jgi:hypothetical protein
MLNIYQTQKCSYLTAIPILFFSDCYVRVSKQLNLPPVDAFSSDEMPAPSAVSHTETDNGSPLKPLVEKSATPKPAASKSKSKSEAHKKRAMSPVADERAEEEDNMPLKTSRPVKRKGVSEPVARGGLGKKKRFGGEFSYKTFLVQVMATVMG